MENNIFGLEENIEDAELLGVGVLRGEQLAKKDIFGVSDPYLVLALHRDGEEICEVRTKTVKKTRNPIWDESFLFRVTRDCVFTVNIFDENRITRDDFLGQVEVKLSDSSILDQAYDEDPGEQSYVLMPRSSRSRVYGTVILRFTRLGTEQTEEVLTVSRMNSENTSAQQLPNVLESTITRHSSFTLPPGWEERQDANGRYFYLNHNLRKTQWDRPTTRSSTDEEITESEREDSDRRRNYESRWQASSDELLQADVAALEEGLRAHFAGDERIQEEETSVDGGGGGGGEPLPHGWDMQLAPNGRKFFIDHTNKTTTWTDPRNGRVSSVIVLKPAGRSSDELGELPAGWEERVHNDGRVFFIDHNTRRTQWEDPRFENASIAGPAVPYSRDYKCKYEYLRLHLPKATSNAKCKLSMRRTHVFEDSYRQIMHLSSSQLRAKLWIEFDGETGLDYGGVAREWFYLLSHSIFNPYYGLFEYSATDNYTLQINPHSETCNPEHLSYFHFIGRIIGIAIYHGKLLDAFFIRPFYKMMLGKVITLNDMESVDNEYFNSLIYIKDNDPSELDLYFAVDEQFYGQTQTVELREGGATEKVTEENKDEYIELVIRWRFVSRVEAQMKELIKGVHEMVPSNLLSIFDPNELELLVCGLQKIDVKDWKDNTLYKGGYTPNQPVIHNFWKCILSFDNEMRARVLQFVTGTSRVPMNGFRELYGSNGPQKFTIEKWGNPDMLPRAHTCFNRMDLPPYGSFHELREKLTVAIENSEIFSGVD